MGEDVNRFQVSDGLGNLEYFGKGGFLSNNQVEFISSPQSHYAKGVVFTREKRRITRLDTNSLILWAVVCEVGCRRASVHGRQLTLLREYPDWLNRGNLKQLIL